MISEACFSKVFSCSHFAERYIDIKIIISIFVFLREREMEAETEKNGKKRQKGERDHTLIFIFSMQKKNKFFLRLLRVNEKFVN